jgi:hypothetical protein
MVEVLSRFGFAQFCSPYFAMYFLFPFVPKKKSGPNLLLEERTFGILGIGVLAWFPLH